MSRRCEVQSHLPLDVIQELLQAKSVGLYGPVDIPAAAARRGRRVRLIEQQLREDLSLLAALAYVSDLRGVAQRGGWVNIV